MASLETRRCCSFHAKQLTSKTRTRSNDHIIFVIMLYVVHLQATFQVSYNDASSSMSGNQMAGGVTSQFVDRTDLFQPTTQFAENYSLGVSSWFRFVRTKS